MAIAASEQRAHDSRIIREDATLVAPFVPSLAAAAAAVASVRAIIRLNDARRLQIAGNIGSNHVKIQKHNEPTVQIGWRDHSLQYKKWQSHFIVCSKNARC